MEGDKREQSPILLKLLCIILIISAAVFIQKTWDIAARFSIEDITVWLDKTGSWAPLLYMAMMAGAIIFSPIPSLPLDISAGIYFGPILGTIYSVIGATIGSSISFLIARLFGRSLVERFLKGHINVCMQCSNRLLTRIVFLSRLIPVISFDVVSYGAGLTKMSLTAFILSTATGMIPLTLLYNYGGSVIRINVCMSLLIGGAVVLLFFIFPTLIERYNLLNLKPYFGHTED